MPQAVIASSTTDRSAVDAERQFEPYRRELTGYCYRMLGSAFEAEDAVQETMVRAWRGLDRFEGRSSLRSWLYRIATNVCLDMLGSSAAPGPPDGPRPARRSPTRVAARRGPRRRGSSPVPDGRGAAGRRPGRGRRRPAESIRLAFVAALQHLPPRQRAVLILREVLRWHADEVAELLDTTVASVNSALQRARATLAEAEHSTDRRTSPADAPTSRRAARPLRRRLRALRHRRACGAAARGRRRCRCRRTTCGCRASDEIERLAARTGRRVPRLAARAGRRPTARPPSGSTGAARRAATSRGR